MNPLPPPVAMAAHGPRTSPIFVGHIKNGTTDKSSDTAGSKESRYVHEMQFNYSVSIEGIHVVPNRVSPPGLPFAGRTKPDMHTRPFLLKIYGRVVSPMAADAATPETVQLLLAVTISGGVQWLPLAAPQCNWKLDYLAIDGDFEEVSLILHGDEFKDVEGGEPTQRLLLPYPDYYDNLIEVISKLPSAASARSASRKPIEIDLTPLAEVMAMSLPMEGSAASVRKLLANCSTTFANSYIWLSEAAQLVETIFSYSPRNEPYQSINDMQSDVEYLEKVNALLESCWETPRQCLSEDYDAASSCLGEETISILCASVQQLLLSFSQQVTQICQLSHDRSRQSIQTEIISYGSELLRCCRLLLTNEFTASEFMISGGMAALCALLYVQPKLPNSLLYDLFLAFYYAARHAKIFQNYFYVPLYPQSSPYSPYQMLLFVLAGTTKGSVLALPSKMLLGMCGYNNALYSLQVLTSQRVGQLVQLAAVVTDRCSTGDQVNITNPWENAEPIDASGGSGSGGNAIGRHQGASDTHTAFVSACAELVTMMKDISDPMRQLVEAWDRMVAMHADMSDLSSKCTEDNTIENTLVSALSHGNFLAITHVVFKLVLLADECIHAATSNPHMNSLRTASQSLRTYTVAVFARMAHANKIDVFLSEQSQDQLCGMLEELWSIDKLASMSSLSLVQSLPLALRGELERDSPALTDIDWLLAYSYCSQRVNAVLSQLLTLCTKLRMAVERDEVIDEYLVHYLKYQYILSHLLAQNTTADLAANLLFYHVFDLTSAVNALLQVVYFADSSHHGSLQAVATFLLSLMQVMINAWDYTGDTDRKKLLNKFLDGLGSITKAFSAVSTASQKVSSEITNHISKMASFVNHVTSGAKLSLEVTPAVLNSDKQATLFLHRLAEIDVSKLDRATAVQQVDALLTEIAFLHVTTLALAEREDLATNPLQRAYLSDAHTNHVQALLGAVATATNIHTHVVSVAANILRLQQAFVSHLWRIVKLSAGHLASLNSYYVDKLVCILVDVFVFVHEDNTAIGSVDIGFNHENLYHRRRSLSHGILLLVMDFCNRSLQPPAKQLADDGDRMGSLHTVRVVLSYLTYRYRLASQVPSVQRPVLALLETFLQNVASIVHDARRSQLMSCICPRPLTLDTAQLQSLSACIASHDGYASEHYSRFYASNYAFDALAETHAVASAAMAARLGPDFSWSKLVVEAMLASSTPRSIAQVAEILRVLLSLSLSGKRPAVGDAVVSALVGKTRQLVDSLGSFSMEEGVFLMRCLQVLLQCIATSRMASVLLVQHGLAALVLQLLHGVVSLAPSTGSSNGESAVPAAGASVGMEGEVSFIAVCLQLVLAMHDRCTTLLPPLPPPASGKEAAVMPDDELLANALHVVGLRSAEELVALLPRILKKYFNFNNSLIQLCLYTFNVLHTEHNYKTFLQTLQGIGEGFTFEFVVVRLWSLLEESFQQVYECLDICKLYSSASATSRAKIDIDKVNNLMYTAHGSFAATVFILRGMLDVGLWGLEHGQLAMNSVNRALRSHMIDPKKVVIRYQRLYSLWVTTARLYTSSRSQNLFVNAAAAEGHRYALNTVDTDGFDARHMLITLSFKSLLELVGKYASLMNTAAAGGGLGTGQTKAGLSSPSSLPVDLAAPLHAVLVAGGKGDLYTRLQGLDRLPVQCRDTSLHLVAQDLVRDLSPVDLCVREVPWVSVQLAWVKVRAMDVASKKRKVEELVTVRLQGGEAVDVDGHTTLPSAIDTTSTLSMPPAISLTGTTAGGLLDRSGETPGLREDIAVGAEDGRWHRSRFRSQGDERSAPTGGLPAAHLPAPSLPPPPLATSFSSSSNGGDAWTATGPSPSWSHEYQGAGRGGEGGVAGYPADPRQLPVSLSLPPPPRPPPPRPPPVPPQMSSRGMGSFGSVGGGNAPALPPPPTFQIPGPPPPIREAGEGREQSWESLPYTAGSAASHMGNGLDQSSWSHGHPETRTRWRPRQ